jgi:hypothetical protein
MRRCVWSNGRIIDEIAGIPNEGLMVCNKVLYQSGRKEVSVERRPLRAVPVIAGVLQGLRNFDPNMREAMNDTGIYDLVDSDHGRVLQVVHTVD